MSSRRLALIGATTGPWVFTARVPQPCVKVRGLGASLMTVTTRLDDVEGAVQVSMDGTHPLSDADWMQVSCEPPCKTVIAEILSGKV